LLPRMAGFPQLLETNILEGITRVTEISIAN